MIWKWWCESTSPRLRHRVPDVARTVETKISYIPVKIFSKNTQNLKKHTHTVTSHQPSGGVVSNEITLTILDFVPRLRALQPFLPPSQVHWLHTCKIRICFCLCFHPTYAFTSRFCWFLLSTALAESSFQAQKGPDTRSLA